MARTALTPLTPVGPHPALPVSANSLDFAFTAGDNSNGNSVAIGRRALLVVTNTSADTARTFTIQSKADDLNREGDIGAYTLGFGEYAAFLIEQKGFLQTDGLIHLDCETDDIEFAVFQLPG